MNTKKKTEDTEQPAVQLEQTETGKQAVGKKFPIPCVYCGPSVRGVAKQYTTYTTRVPEKLEEFIDEHPAARGLVVPTSSFAQTRRNLGIAGTREAILYQKVKNEL